jgi:hypothetical protein
MLVISNSSRMEWYNFWSYCRSSTYFSRMKEATNSGNIFCEFKKYVVNLYLFVWYLLYMSYRFYFLKLGNTKELLPPIGNKCRQFCISLVQSLYYVPDSYFRSEGVAYCVLQPKKISNAHCMLLPAIGKARISTVYGPTRPKFLQ